MESGQAVIRLRTQVASFVAVGLCVTIVFAVAAYVLARADVDEAWSNVIAYSLTTPIAFLGQSRFTFKRTDRPAHYAVRFLLAVLVVNGAIHLVGRFWPEGGSEAWLAFSSWCLLTVGNFAAFKFWVFK